MEAPSSPVRLPWRQELTAGLGHQKPRMLLICSILSHVLQRQPTLSADMEGDLRLHKGKLYIVGLSSTHEGLGRAHMPVIQGLCLKVRFIICVPCGILPLHSLQLPTVIAEAWKQRSAAFTSNIVIDKLLRSALQRACTKSTNPVQSSKE